MNYVIANPEKSSQIFEEKDVDKTDVKFNNPDKEYEILDDGEYSNADTFSNRPETPTTNTTENNDNHETHDFCLDEFAMNYAKEYATSMVTDFEKEEVHVDWFGSDIDIQSEVESIWTSSADDNENTDYELNGNGGNIENQCVIIDIVDGIIQRYTNNAYRPIKQLMGVWELDYNTVETCVNANGQGSLHLLGVCSSHFNWDQDGAHKRGLKGTVSINKSWIHLRRCLFCGNNKYFVSRGGCKYHS